MSEVARLWATLGVDVSEFDARMAKADRDFAKLGQQASQATGSVKTFSNEVVASADKQSKAERELAHDMRRKIELEKEWQAAQAKRAQLTVRRAELRANSEVINQFQKVDKTSTKASFSVGRLNQSFGALAARAAHVHPITGQVAASLGSFALGSAMTVGVLGGLAAIGLAWNKLTEDMREAKKETKELIASTDALMDSLRNTELAKLEKQLMEEEEAFRKTTAALEGFDTVFQKGGANLRRTLVANLDETNRRLTALRNKIGEVKADQIAANTEKWNAAQERLVKSLRAGDKDAAARVRAITTLVAASRATAAETAELREAQARFRDVMRGGTADVHARVEAMTELTRIHAAFTAAFLRDNGRMLPRQIDRLRVTGAGTVRADNLPTAEAERAALGMKRMSQEMLELQRVAGGVAMSFADTFGAIVSGTTTAADAFRNLAQSILRDLAAMIARMAIFHGLMALFGGPALGKVFGSSLMDFDIGGGTRNVTSSGVVARGVTPSKTVAVQPMPSLSFIVNVPPAADPISFSRDAQWQRAWREAALQAEAQGFQFRFQTNG